MLLLLLLLFEMLIELVDCGCFMITYKQSKTLQNINNSISLLPSQMTQHPHNLSQTHILKIVLKGKTFPTNIGIRTNPKQTYGISPESPSYFNTSCGLVAQNGYIYQQEIERQNKELYLPPFSQNKYCSVVGNTIDVVDSFRDKYQVEESSHGRFHRRKGRLGEFMDKNGWMNGVYKMMGFQRSDQARAACNRDRQKNIQSARRPNPYINPVEKKISVPKQSYINSLLLTQKTKLRYERKALRQQKQDALNIQKLMTITSKKSPQKDMYIDAQNLTNRMSRTANQKEWKQTMSKIREKYRKNENTSEQMNLTKSDWSTNNQSVELKERRIIRDKDELKDWFNTTCNSNANPWSYHKARKMATGSDEEIMD